MAFSSGPALVYKYFPVFNRFKYSFIYALSRALVYVVTSFGLVYLTEFFGHWGSGALLILAAIVYIYSLKQFEALAALAPQKKLLNLPV